MASCVTGEFALLDSGRQPPEGKFKSAEKLFAKGSFFLSETFGEMLALPHGKMVVQHLERLQRCDGGVANRGELRGGRAIQRVREGIRQCPKSISAAGSCSLAAGRFLSRTGSFVLVRRFRMGLSAPSSAACSRSQAKTVFSLSRRVNPNRRALLEEVIALAYLLFEMLKSGAREPRAPLDPHLNVKGVT